MEMSTIWWIGFGIMVASELVTGTFYLLMLAVAFASGALCAHAGLPVTAQMSIASVMAIVLSFGPLPKKLRHAISTHKKFSLGDQGSTVIVSGRQANGLASAIHRGASWTVQLEHPDGAPLKEGDLLTIIRIDGVSLVCTRSTQTTPAS
jgi:membrane protein implicated in regulation of membrane protease activity